MGNNPTVRTVLSDQDIQRAIRRMAHELLERNDGAERLVLLGIPTRGLPLAHRLAAAIHAIEGAAVPCLAIDPAPHRDDLGRGADRSGRSPDRARPAPSGAPLDADQVSDRVVVLVDDVLHTGRTVRAAMDAVSAAGRPRAIRLAVLVDRGHRELPIRADHVGKNLPSAADERVQLRLAEPDGMDAVQILREGEEAR
ncbi:bifunctional pyr operon transcriptional regulator/uracil phosphoribosyltransferase PyrR [Kytococcus sedentarius]|uniref:Bifunctional protein PyrR n=1 Tax=Kytococcus sedentarius (strain ATCC 14392 / DSM 20547 / JCM 11482 / CCUG 33030 / NBRC 15357 / NCTC 11040 / CCM 314 / 541) TaxID=478801 RepID=C7NHE0_KYTSD|nr:bifunctional pyr operon transcriptional regulator/uracil phosphoribosyltransferase PyrR [Kytococcus sedentarius]ACV06297.1 pyrimidine operon attenuation protein/uracil phosphoribosyltransferase [Kytococcus sedentarius DSM 20547]STX12285.1 Bifunctional protein pyrR [Kytococcus sedentarius]